MEKMLSLFLIYLLHSIHGHSDTEPENNLEIRNDADLQAELIPQELNTKFVPAGKNSPWRAVLPLSGRSRRQTDVVSVVSEIPGHTGVSHKLKWYSRIASCIALILAAVIEVALYIAEFYYT